MRYPLVRSVCLPSLYRILPYCFTGNKPHFNILSGMYCTI